MDAIAQGLDASVRTYTQVEIASSQGTDPTNEIIEKITPKEKA